MEQEKLKTLQDFLSEGKTESDYWTYRIIHKEEFDRLEEESEEKKEYPYLILQCMNCGQIIDENITKPDITLPYNLRVKCKCGKFKFRAITEERKKELEKEKKKKEKNGNSKLTEYQIKKILSRIEIDLNKVNSDLTDYLNDGKISDERYIVLMIKLIGNQFDYYSSDIGKKFDWKKFRDYSLSTAKANLEKKYDCEILDEKLDSIANTYNEEKDSIYLEEYNILLSGSMEVEQDSDRLEELKRKKKSIEAKQEILTALQEKSNERERRAIERINEEEQNRIFRTFKDQLKKDIKKQ